MVSPILSPAPTPGNDALLSAALDYARRLHWCVIPIKNDGDKKKAACPWKRFQSTRPDEPTLRQLFSRQSITGLALVMGAVSGGVCCRDYDDLTAYEKWATSHPDLAQRLPTAETKRGRHLYFAADECFARFDDGELRGTSGQITVLPPSQHPSGVTYRWLIEPGATLPRINPAEVGLCNREHREHRVDGDDREHTDNTPVPPTSPLLSLYSLLQSEAVQYAIQATLPVSEGQRRDCLFRFARHLKGIESLRNLEAGDLRPIIEEWHRRALPTISTKPLLETWTDFVVAWPAARVPIGEGPVDAAFARAVGAPPPAQAIALYGDDPIVLLAALCRELQQVVGSGEFFIDCRTAGRLLGIDHTTAWRYLAVLCADRILSAGAKGHMATSTAPGRSSRFRYMGGME